MIIVGGVSCGKRFRKKERDKVMKNKQLSRAIQDGDGDINVLVIIGRLAEAGILTY